MDAPALEVALVAGQSTVTAAYASSPFKLLTPRSRAESVWAYTSSFGGGLVAGDQTSLDVRIGAGARCFLSTQASTKVYRNPAHRPCAHRTRGVVEAERVARFCPRPVQPFADSIYRATAGMAAGAGRGAGSFGLVLLAGGWRVGNDGSLTRFESRNDMFIGDERVFVDSVLLDDRSRCSARPIGWAALSASPCSCSSARPGAISPRICSTTRPGEPRPADGELLWSASPSVTAPCFASPA